jgi:hypothetical protein
MRAFIATDLEGVSRILLDDQVGGGVPRNDSD